MEILFEALVLYVVWNVLRTAFGRRSSRVQQKNRKRQKEITGMPADGNGDSFALTFLRIGYSDDIYYKTFEKQCM